MSGQNLLTHCAKIGLSIFLLGLVVTCVIVLHLESSNTQVVNVLKESLRNKLQDAASTETLEISSLTCQQLNISNYDVTTSQQHLHETLPKDLDLRIESLTSMVNLPVSDEISQVLQEMSSAVEGHHEIILLTATSSNHFQKNQALLKNLHDVVFPFFPNIKLVFYDIGLTQEQKSQVERHCRCTVVSFPFYKLPRHISYLNCYAWKVMIIAAHYEQAEVVVWMDSSIRVLNVTSFATMVQRTKHRGVSQRIPNKRVPNIKVTLPQMFEMFGDSPCAHDKVPQIGAAFGMYHREDLIRHAVIRPWLGCAVNQFCICPVDPVKVIRCNSIMTASSASGIGKCHRFDQSALTIILAKLFRDKYFYVTVESDRFVDVDRSDFVKYFEELEEREQQQE